MLMVTIYRTDLMESRDYVGADLRLPANTYEIQDAMERARITDGQPYTIMECRAIEGVRIDYIPEHPHLDELNFLASRLAEMEDWERITLKGLVMMEKEPPSMQRLINLTDYIQDTQCFSVKDDAELGEIYLNNNFVDAVRKLPEECREILEYIDHEKLGRLQREAEGGVFVDGHYVVDDGLERPEIYDGVHLPEQPDIPGYVFRLHLRSSDPDPNAPLECEALSLPATEEEIKNVCSALRTPDLEYCYIERSESIIPHFDNKLSFAEDIEKVRILADKIMELKEQGLLPKYKAALEFADCGDVGHALDLASSLNCFDFYPEIGCPAQYGQKMLLQITNLKPDDLLFKHADLSWYGYAMMEQNHVSGTDYGYIRENGREFVYEHMKKPEQGQRMGSM